MIKYVILLVFVGFVIQCPLNAQTNRVELQKSREPAIKDTLFLDPVHIGDSIIHVNLRPFEIVRPYIFKNRREEKKYDQLVIDVKRAYPLSLIVVSEIKLVNSELDSLYKDQKSRKTYIKWYQDYVYKTYIDSLKSLNVRQGKLFLKLIRRETGRSPYELIKEYRGGVKCILLAINGFYGRG